MLFGLIIALVAALVLASLVFGLDTVLNTISTAFVLGLGTTIAFGALALAAIVIIFTVRDALDETRTDRKEGKPWLWRFAGWIGIAGILVDGGIGAWNVYQQHVLFSTAIKEIPFAGVPVLLVLAAYPLKLVEQLLIKRFTQRHPQP